MKKTIQLYDSDKVKMGQQMTSEQIVKFLDDYRILHGNPKLQKSKLISLKVQQGLLNTFRFKCEQQGLKYQTQIKALMANWVKDID